MNRDDIIRMAREAHRELVTKDYPGHVGQLDPWTMRLLERFAALVAAHEREVCAQVCDDYGNRSGHGGIGFMCAEAIRASGEEPKRHPGYIIGDHWLQAAYTRVCTGEDIRQVMEDYGYYP